MSLPVLALSAPARYRFWTIGTAVAQQHLRTILAYLDMPTLGQPKAFIQAKEGLFDDAGGIGPDSRGFLLGLMDWYLAWVA